MIQIKIIQTYNILKVAANSTVRTAENLLYNLDGRFACLHKLNHE